MDVQTSEQANVERRHTFNDPSTPDCASELLSRICISVALIGGGIFRIED